jgi:hypothetical protein
MSLLWSPGNTSLVDLGTKDVDRSCENDELLIRLGSRRFRPQLTVSGQCILGTGGFFVKKTYEDVFQPIFVGKIQRKNRISVARMYSRYAST